MRILNKKIELLAPARDLEAGKLAADFGADALYIGASLFGAREAAGNGTADIAKLARYAHAYGVRVYAALNTLLCDDELQAAEKLAGELCEAGVDALIVQDMAYTQMNLPITLHASTQTTNLTPERVNFLAANGFSRVILERGLTFDQIEAIAAQSDVELEAFIHGAVCVGYSGQCYLSRTMGPRSGNRGNCSQACRMTYDLVDQRGRTVLKEKHLLSVQDLNLTARLGAMLDAGITSFKIEGRLKDNNYLKNSVAHYRLALDKELKQRELERCSSGVSTFGFAPDPAKSFTRDGAEYFFAGKRQGVATFDTPKATGSAIGSVIRVDRDRFQIKYNGSERLSSGDGVCYVTPGGLLGTNINRVEGEFVYPNRVEGLDRGMTIYRNYDHTFSTMLDSATARRAIAVTASVGVGNGEIALSFADIDGHKAIVYQTVTDIAKNSAKMRETLVAQLRKSGDTIFDVERVEINVSDAELPFVAISAINELRRAGLEKLREARLAKYQKHAAECPASTCPTIDKVVSTDNVINRLAENFYRKLGVEDLERGMDLARSPKELVGKQVMRSAYCIRREIGQCLKKNPESGGDLRLVRGEVSYLLRFDCRRCEMELIFEG